MAKRLPNIADRELSYAFGMGWVTQKGRAKFFKVFGHRDKPDGELKANDEVVRDFQRILVEAGLYNGGNEEILLNAKEIDGLIDSFSKHEGTTKFLKALKKKLERKPVTAFIVLMHHETPPATYLQALLLTQMFRKNQM